MIYFKTVTFDDCNRTQMENALRKVALKRTLSLDLGSSSTDIGTDKLFYGYEGKNGLTFTRVKASFERLLPKTIIRLLPSINNCGYEIRLSLISTCVFISISILWFVGLIVLIKGGNTLDAFAFSTLFVGCYFTALFLELRLTTLRMNKAIKLYLHE